MKSEVYTQSTWLTMKVATLYYIQGLSGKEIADLLNISPATISRLLHRAKNSGIISFQICTPFLECLEVSQQLCQLYNLKEVIVIPSEQGIDNNSRRQAVALEGARYLQRIISDNDILGIAWGRTMNHLIQVLNPCQKTDNSFVSMHGSIPHCQYDTNVTSLISRISMALGGQTYYFNTTALTQSKEELQEILSMDENCQVVALLNKITISIAGVGSLYPNLDSPLLKNNYLSTSDIHLIQEKGVYGDILLRFFDENGNECDTHLKERTLSIEFDTYRKIPTRIVVASGSEKAYTMRAVLRGQLANVIIIDYDLAKQILLLGDK